MILSSRLQGRLARRGRDLPADSYPDSPWALLLTIAVLATGVGFAGAGHWRMGAMLMGGSLLLGALLRLVLPRMAAGLLVVRRRWIDVTVLALFGTAVVVLAMVVPPSSP